MFNCPNVFSTLAIVPPIRWRERSSSPSLSDRCSSVVRNSLRIRPVSPCRALMACRFSTTRGRGVTVRRTLSWLRRSISRCSRIDLIRDTISEAPRRRASACSSRLSRRFQNFQRDVAGEIKPRGASSSGAMRCTSPFSGAGSAPRRSWTDECSRGRIWAFIANGFPPRSASALAGKGARVS